jgi:hypothetical protein
MSEQDSRPFPASLRWRLGFLAILSTGALLSACRDVSRFTTAGDHYEGPVVAADFVRVGVDSNVNACLTIDANRLQDSGGSFSTSDGRFHVVPLRPIPAIWHDPLSTLSFGDGRLENLIYAARVNTQFDAGPSDDVLAVVSLMQAGDVEIRVIHPGGALFAIFDLQRASGPCSY